MMFIAPCVSLARSPAPRLPPISAQSARARPAYSSLSLDRRRSAVGDRCLSFAQYFLHCMRALVREHCIICFSFSSILLNSSPEKSTRLSSAGAPNAAPSTVNVALVAKIEALRKEVKDFFFFILILRPYVWKQLTASGCGPASSQRGQAGHRAARARRAGH
jgi:hypothetical protein